MKSALQKSPIPDSHAFLVKELKEPFFDHQWHFHPEFQLFMVLKGTGTRFIGDHVQPFKEGDMVFTGPNLPHLWRSDHKYFEAKEELKVEGIVIYFQEDFFGKDFLEKEEMLQVQQLFHQAKRGMEIVGSTAAQISQLMKELLRLNGFERVIKLMQILHILAQTSEYRLLSSSGYTNSQRKTDSERMNKVHTFIMEHFNQKISLEEAAAIANMTAASFSRYFKTHSNKTFSDFVSEIRVGHACKLLMENNLAISQICYECGFQTLSNFNRQFKNITRYSPREYRKEHAKAGAVQL